MTLLLAVMLHVGLCRFLRVFIGLHHVSMRCMSMMPGFLMRAGLVVLGRLVTISVLVMPGGFLVMVSSLF